MNFIDDVIIDPIVTFAGNSRYLIRRCDKPTYDEFTANAIAALIGFVVMGFLGFFVKLVFIPINNVILGS